MGKNITWLGSSYTGVEQIELPQTGGGNALFADPSVTTAVEADVVSGKTFLKADGSIGIGTNSGGGTTYTATIDGATGNSVTYNNVAYTVGDTFTFSEGETASVRCDARSNCYVYVDGTQVAYSNNGMLTYSYTLPDHNIKITYTDSDALTRRAYITNNGGGGGINLQTKSKTYTPSGSTQTEDVTADSGYDGLDKVSVTVNPIPSSYIIPTGNKEITANGTNIDVAQYATASVNVPTGGGGLTLLKETSLGSLSTTSTSGTDTSKSLSLASSTGWSNYDMLLIDVSVNTQTNGRHTSTVSTVFITHQSSYGTPSNYAVGGNKWNSKRSSNGTASTRQSTTAYGIYANSVSVSSGTMTIPLYMKYNSNNTGTINGTYTARVYGLKLYDLIGG